MARGSPGGDTKVTRGELGGGGDQNYGDIPGNELDPKGSSGRT